MCQELCQVGHGYWKGADKTVIEWKNEGYDPCEEIYPAVRLALDQNDGVPPFSINYFTPIIEAQRMKRKNADPSNYKTVARDDPEFDEYVASKREAGQRTHFYASLAEITIPIDWKASND